MTDEEILQALIELSKTMDHDKYRHMREAIAKLMAKEV